MDNKEIHFRAGLRRLQVTMTDEQVHNCMRFAALLLRWNATYNLTAIRQDQEVITHHLLDSIAVDPVLNQYLSHARSLLDVGSGGGLPVIPLSILHPTMQIHAVDTVKKKTSFLTQVGIELRLKNFVAYHARVQNLKGQYDVISSRAFASLKDFVEWTEHLLGVNGRWFAMKGVYPEKEIAELPAFVDVRHCIRLTVPDLEEERHILILKRK